MGGHYGLCRCPAHDDRNPSLKIKDDPTNRDGINLVCFAGCDWRDVKAALRQQGLIVDGHDTQTNVSGRKLLSVTKMVSDRKSLSSDDDEKRRAEYALKLWAQSVPLPNTLGWRYFTERRELHIGTLDDLSHALRWHDDDAAVIALMTDPISNEPIGIHRTFLNPDGTKRERKMLGKAGVIRLSPDENVTGGLGITEGVEDGLSVLLSGWAPVWAASSAGAISRLPVLSGVECLTIFADCEQVGMNAAIACADRWEAAGRDVAIQEQEYCYDANIL